MIVRSLASSRARATGIAALVVGAWGALIPFAGPSFGYGMGSSQAWAWTESRVTLHLLPGLAAIIGGLLLASAARTRQAGGALIALLGGVWFVIAPSLHPLWADTTAQSMSGGMMHAESAMSSALSALGYHYGTGALIIVAGAYALGVLATASHTAAPGTEMHRESGPPRSGSARDAALIDV